jgi:hypothetical protein
MKHWRYLIVCTAVLGACALFGGEAAAAQPNPPAGDLPEAYFPQRAFEFEPVIDGVKVIHDFLVVNRGAAPLLIENVKTG